MQISIFTSIVPNQYGTYLCNVKISNPGNKDHVSAVYVNTGNELNSLASEKELAELISIQHTLFHSNIFEGNTLKNLQICVSSGKVKKALLGRGEPLLNRYASPVRLQVEKLEIKVENQKPDWWISKATKNLQNGPIYTNTHLKSVTHLGDLLITSSAIHRYQEKSTHSLGSRFKLLVRELQMNLHRISFPEHILQRKLVKYGHKAKFAEFWSSDKGDHVFVVLNEPTQPKTLVSCYPKA